MKELPVNLSTCDCLVDIVFDESILHPPQDVLNSGTVNILKFLSTGEKTLNLEDVSDRTIQMQAKVTNFKIGDKVLVTNPVLKKGHIRKFNLKYVGPYSVVGVSPNNPANVTIQLPNRTQLVHKNRIKLFKGRLNSKGNTPPLLSDKPDTVKNITARDVKQTTSPAVSTPTATYNLRPRRSTAAR